MSDIDERRSNAYWKFWVESHHEVRFRQWPTAEQLKELLA